MVQLVDIFPHEIQEPTHHSQNHLSMLYLPNVAHLTNSATDIFINCSHLSQSAQMTVNAFSSSVRGLGSKNQLDMSMARQRLKSPQSLSGTSAHPTMVTLVNIMVMNGWLTSFSFHVNRLSHSWDKAISDFDLEISTPGSRSWVWSKGKVIQSAQYYINLLRFHFTSIRPTIPEIELFRNLTLKHPHFFFFKLPK